MFEQATKLIELRRIWPYIIRDKVKNYNVLNFSDVAVAEPDEKATDSVKMRFKPSDKERVFRAAELTLIKLTTFIWASAAKEAERVLGEHQTTTLSQRDTLMVLNALDNPPPPTPAAREAVRGYRSRIANAK